MANLVKSVMLKIVADDGDSEAKLDKITEKAEELGRLHPDLKVKVDSAAASAKLAVLRRELKDTSNAADGDSTSLKSRLMGLTGAVSSITGLGDAFALANPEASMFQKVMAGASLATGLLEPVMAGVVVGVAGLGSGIAAAGVGAGVFGLVAKQAFSAVSTNIKSATTAYEQLSTAQTKAQKTAALEAWKKSLSGLNQGQRELVIDTAKAESTWNSFVKNSTAGIAQTLAPALALLPKALGFASQFLGPVEAALQDVIIDVKQALDSPFWKSTISEWAATSGPMIEDIAVAIGHVIHGVAGILTTFMPMSTSLGSGLDSITEKFAKWGETLGSHSGFQSLMSMFKSETPMALGTLKNLATAIINIGKAMTGMDGVGNSKTLLQVLKPLSGVLASLSKNPDLDRIGLYLLAGADAGKKLKNTVDGISGAFSTIGSGGKGVSNLVKGFKDSEAAADEATGKMGSFGGAVKTAFSAIGSGASSGLGFLTGLPGKLKDAASAAKDWGIWSKIASGATKVWSGIQAAFNIIMDANPIVLVTIAIVALVAGIVYAYIHFKTFRDIVNDVGRAIKTGFLDAVHAVEAGAKAVASFVVSAWNGVWNTTQSVWNDIKKVVSTVIGAVTGFVKSQFTDIENVIKDAWDLVKTATSDVWGWIKSFIGTEISGIKNILNWFSNLGNLFEGWWNKGYSAVKSVASNLIGFVRGIPGKILSALGNLGSLLFNAGKNVIQGLINGISSMIGSVGSAIGKIAGEITSHLPFSPAKKGPLSGAGSPDISGRKIGQMLAAGITSSTPDVTASAHKMAAAAAVTASGGAAGAGGAAGGAQQIQLSIPNGSNQNLVGALLLAMRKEIRVSYGGNVQTALGH